MTSEGGPPSPPPTQMALNAKNEELERITAQKAELLAGLAEVWNHLTAPARHPCGQRGARGLLLSALA